MISSATSTVTVDALKAANVEALRSAADLFTRNGDKTSRHAANAREQAKWGADWSGQAADAAGHATDSAANQLDTAGFSSSTIGQLAGTHADVLGPTRSVVRTTVGLARGALMSVHQDGEVSARHLAFIPGIGEAAQNLALVLTNILRGALQLASVLDRVSGTAISAISGTVAPPRSDVGVGEVEGASSIKSPQNLPPVQRVDTPHGPVVTVGDVEGADEVITLVSGVGSSNADTHRGVGAGDGCRCRGARQERGGGSVAWLLGSGGSARRDLPGASAGGRHRAARASAPTA